MHASELQACAVFRLAMMGDGRRPSRLMARECRLLTCAVASAVGRLVADGETTIDRA